METFLASATVERVEGLNSEKTLNRWKRIVQENFGADYFSVENLQFNRKGNRRPVIVYSLEDIKRFQNVADILSKQSTNRKNLNEAIHIAFSADTPLIKSKSELEVFSDDLSIRFEKLERENRSLLGAIQMSNQKIAEIQATLETIRENKPKLFKKSEKKEGTRW